MVTNARAIVRVNGVVVLTLGMALAIPLTAVAATLNVIRPGLGQVGASERYEAVNAF
jgi:hypothetical protein